MKRLLFLSILFPIFYFLSFVPAMADTVCQPIYGGGQTCVQAGNLVLNKAVLNPATNDYVDNLGVNDPKYSPEDIVTFRITLKNTGNATINRVDVKDIIPSFLNFGAGAGSFDANTKTFSFSLANLNPNEQRTYFFTGQIVKNDQLPSDKGIICVVNQAMATGDGISTADNAEFCLQKQVVETKGGLKVFPPAKVVTTPPTGPELLPLLALIPSGIFGVLLRRRSTPK